MCLVAISWKNHSEYPLIISANRDEFFTRPTGRMHRWESGFYAGKDLRSGGTWLGFHPNGRWALLTNYRDFLRQQNPTISRGKLVEDFLTSQEAPQSYLEKIKRNRDLYDGFNLMVSEGDQLFYYSNFGEEIEEIPPGIHALSNGLINAPWPKAELAKLQLGQETGLNVSLDSLLKILKSEQKSPIQDLPSTGIPEEMEIALSSQLIRLNENYGTVSSTAVLRHRFGLTQLKERTFDWDFHKYSDQEFQFHLNKPIETL